MSFNFEFLNLKVLNGCFNFLAVGQISLKFTTLVAMGGKMYFCVSRN